MRYQPVPDYHMHTPRCHHAIGTVREYAEAAVLAGLTEIGMSDHSPMPGAMHDGWRMDREELSDYLKEVERVRDTFSDRLTVRIGLEADFRPGSESYIEALIDAYEWDYVIGSVHYINDWGFDNPDDMSRWEQCDIEATYCDYFDLVGRSAATGMFDIIGHPDLIKKFGHRPPAGSESVQTAMEAMLQQVKRAGCALEISSAGLRKPVGEAYPHGRMLVRAGELGIPFAFGSDAHSPGEVGHAMDACLTMLEFCGIHEVSGFSGRQRTRLPIRPLRHAA
ncbi:MAG TPA: histidinol-phosphatase HisJ [Mariprofundaceae bacterium]|nr:histidinol-phosphatase HisJ [Mariprofundaceae bacterium]